MSKQDRADVATVLGNCFVLGHRGYTQERADQEIEYAAPKIASAQANGKRGGRPQGSKNKPTGFLKETLREPKSKAPHPQPHSGEEPIGSPPPAGDNDAVLTAVRPTGAGLICGALKRAGFTNVSPSHPGLVALLTAGATEGEFLAFADQALTKNDPFAYLLTVVQSQRIKAAQLVDQMHRGELPATESAYAKSMRQKYEEVAPAIAARAPGVVRPNPMDVLDGLTRITA
jgi:hypothetical protein